MYSVKDEEKKDLMGTLGAVAEMGYEGVEFWAPHLEWTPAYAKEVRKTLDQLALRAFSTHNRAHDVEPESGRAARHLAREDEARRAARRVPQPRHRVEAARGQAAHRHPHRRDTEGLRLPGRHRHLPGRGRVKSYHLKDWSPEPDKGYKVLLGEGIGKWKELVAVAEKVGGVEYYLIEQEGSRFPPMETAKRCLENFRKLRA